MDRSETLALADDFLSNIGDHMDYTTLPQVLSPGRIPAWAEARSLRSAEDLLLDMGLVEQPESDFYTPGGNWSRLRLTPKGYDLVASRDSVRRYLSKEELIYERFRCIYEVLDSRAENSMQIKVLKKILSGNHQQTAYFKRDIKHFRQIGWLATSRSLDKGSLMVRLKDAAWYAYEDFDEGLGTIKQNPLTGKRKKARDFVKNYTLKDLLARRKSLQQKEKEIFRELYPGMPFGLREKIWFRLGGNIQLSESQRINEAPILSEKQRRQLSRFTAQEVGRLLLTGVILLFLIWILWNS